MYIYITHHTQITHTLACTHSSLYICIQYTFLTVRYIYLFAMCNDNDVSIIVDLPVVFTCYYTHKVHSIDTSRSPYYILYSSLRTYFIIWAEVGTVLAKSFRYSMPPIFDNLSLDFRLSSRIRISKG